MVAPSMYDCQDIAQQILWRYDDIDEVALSHFLDRLQSPRSSSTGRDLVKSLEVTDRLSLRILMSDSDTPDDQPYICIIGLVKVRVYWAI